MTVMGAAEIGEGGVRQGATNTPEIHQKPLIGETRTKNEKGREQNREKGNKRKRVSPVESFEPGVVDDELGTTLQHA